MPPVAAGAETAEKLLGGRLYSHRSKFPRAVTSRRGNGQANKSKETPDMTNDTRTRATYSTISHTVLDDVLDAGVSSGAVHLYVVLGRYTDNDTGRAFPSRATLAKAMGKTLRTIDTYIRELVKIGAILVTRRRRAGTMENRSSVYTLHRELADRIERAETPEVVQPTAPGGAADCAENYPHPTTLTPSTSTPAGADARPTPSTHSVPVARPIFDRARRQPATNPGNLNPAARRNLRQRLQHIGRLLAAGHHWWDDTTQDAVDTFTADLEHHIPDFADLEHKWSCTAAVADPYQAGVKLNKLIHTAHTGGIHPAA